MRGIIWAPSARSDLNRITAWLDENRDAQTCADTLEAIQRRAEFLMDFPRGGRPLGDGKRLLRIIGTPYLIVYRLSDTQTEVVRVHHEREDWQTAV